MHIDRVQAFIGAMRMDASQLKGKKGLTRLINALGYSVNGFSMAWRNEAAFRQEVVASVILVPLAFWLDVSTLERIALIGALVLVVTIELLNTAIEAAIDRIGPEYHELSGRAKDLGSAAVLVALCFTAYVWIAILLRNFSPF